MKVFHLNCTKYGVLEQCAVLLGDQAAKQKCTIPVFYDRVSKVESGIIACSFPYAIFKVSFFG